MSSTSRARHEKTYDADIASRDIAHAASSPGNNTIITPYFRVLSSNPNVLICYQSFYGTMNETG